MRTLVDLAIAACDESAPVSEYGLVAVDALTLAARGAAGAAEAEIAVGRVGHTARDLSSGAAGLEILILVRSSADGIPVNHWVLDGWRLIRSYGADTDLSHARLRGAQLSGARLKGTDLSEADLAGADLEKADLSSAKLVGANLAGASLHRSSLCKADLREADLRRTDLRHADLREAACARTAFRGSDLWDAYFWDIDLSESFLEGTEVERAYQPR